MRDSNGSSHVLCLKNGTNVRVDCAGAGIFRIRAGAGDCLHESGLNRYGVIRINQGMSSDAGDFSKDSDGWAFATSAAVLRIGAGDGRICLAGTDGRAILEEQGRECAPAGGGFAVSFKLKRDERLYGLGDVDRKCVQRRGGIYDLKTKNVDAYIPIPFLMSSSGWAIFMNTTWFHAVDAGATDPDVLRYSAPRGYLDYYLIAGDFPKILLERYTRIAGRSSMLPAWGYGLTFVCDERGVRARDMLYEAYEFRRQGIPCDVIGLEPGWMEKRYDYSVDKEWSGERFHIPSWLQGKPFASFPAVLKKMGFKLSLWLCCDYDLSEHEERQLTGAMCGDGKEESAAHASSTTALIEDEHLKGAVYQDEITRPGEAWFEHLKKFVDDGARAFKMDGAKQVLFHPDRKWKNGMDDAEMHNLYPVLLAKQMSRGYTDHAGNRSMIYTAGGYAGIQQYAATWAGDTGGGAEPLVSLLNHGFSGHSNVTVDMDVHDEQGIHFGFFQPWCQVLGWYMYNQPWFQGERLAAIFTDYAKLRYRLHPYVYSMAALAAKTGFPIMRAMSMAFPADMESDARTLQYMFGDAFMTAAFTDKIYLPAGAWFDYWTGARARGPATLPVSYPEGKGGALFVRAGAIIPMAPEMAYWGHKPADVVTLDIFPGNRDEPFELYEDDGESEAYLQGEFAVTRFNQTLEAGGLTITISPRTGRYDGICETRKYRLEIHCARPETVRINGAAGADWNYDVEKSLLIMPFPAICGRDAAEIKIMGAL